MPRCHPPSSASPWARCRPRKPSPQPPRRSATRPDAPDGMARLGPARVAPAERDRAAAALLRPGRRRRNALFRHRWAYLFIAPFFILFALFFVFPIAFSFCLSLNDWRGSGPMRFVGAQNYIALLRDGTFWNSMANAAVLFLLYVPFMTVVAVLLAAALNDRFVRLRGFWKAVIFLPYITSMVAVGFTFRLIFDTRSGIANDLLAIVGLGPVPWLDDPWGAKVTLEIGRASCREGGWSW